MFEVEKDFKLNLAWKDIFVKTGKYADMSNKEMLEAKNQELQTANFHLSQQAQTAGLIAELRPCAKPAYITCSPYVNTGCGC